MFYSFKILLVSVVSVMAFPTDYNYDNYVNVNLDNTNANAYYMENKPGLNFDYSPVHYSHSPFSNYYGHGLYRHEPMGPAKPQFVYPFHTIFVITTGHGQGNNGGMVQDYSMNQQQGFGGQEHEIPIFHSGHPGHVQNMDFPSGMDNQDSTGPMTQNDDSQRPMTSSEVFQTQQQDDQQRPMTSSEMFHPQQDDQQRPMTSSEMFQVPQQDDQQRPISSSEIFLPQEYTPFEVQAHVENQPEVVDYPVVIPVPNQNEQQDDVVSVQAKEEGGMNSVEKVGPEEVMNKSQESMMTQVETTSVSPMPVSVPMGMEETDNVKLIPNVESGDSSPPIHPRDEQLKEMPDQKLGRPSTFKTIDADDEVFMTTESIIAPVSLEEMEKVTTELPLEANK